MKGKKVGSRECYNGEAERNVVGAFEKEIMSRAGVEFRQDKRERVASDRKMEDGRKSELSGSN